MDGLIFEREVVFRRNCLRRTAPIVGGGWGRFAPLGEVPGMPGVFQILCRLPFHPLLGRGRRVRFSGGRMGNWAGFHRPGLCPRRASGAPWLWNCATPPSACFVRGLTGAVCRLALLGAPAIPLDGLRPLLGLTVWMEGPVNEVSRLIAYLIKGCRAGLFYLIHRLDVGGRLLPGPFLFHQLLTELGGHPTADVPHRPSAVLAFPLVLIDWVPVPWFWHGTHLRFASHGEIYFSTWFNTSAIPAMM